MTTANSICEKAKVYYYDYLIKQDVELIPAEMAGHLEQCRFCRAKIKLLAEELEQVDVGKNTEVNTAVVMNLRLHFAYVDKPVGCKTVRPFLPGLVDETLKVGIPTPITVHLDNCEKCEAEFKRIKSLGLGQKELFKLAQGLAKKPKVDESGVVTRYKIKGEAGADSLLANQDTPYEQWPIEVEVLRKLQEVVVGATLGEEKRRLDLRPFVKPILAAAAVVLVAIFVMHSNLAKGVDLEQIYNAIRQAKNIYIVTFDPESTRSTSAIAQEVWISRDLNVKVNKTGSTLVLWDLDKKIQKSKDASTGIVKTKSLDENAVLKISESMDKTLVLLPFVSMPDVLNKDSDAKWEKVTDKNIALSNTDIYDLMWLEKTIKGDTIYNRWRCFIGCDKKLPHRVEHWQKQSKNDEYKPSTIIHVIYPTDNEISSVIQSAGF